MLTKFQLFVVSTLPVWLILFAKNIPYWYEDNSSLPSLLVLAVAAIFSLYGLYLIYCIRFKLKGSPNSLPVTIVEVKDKTSEYVNSLSTLFSLFPFVSSDVETPKDLIVALLILGVVYVCFTKSNLYYSNPVLALLGLKIGEVVTSEDCKELPTNSIVIYRGELRETMSPYVVDDKVYFLV